MPYKRPTPSLCRCCTIPITNVVVDFSTPVTARCPTLGAVSTHRALAEIGVTNDEACAAHAVNVAVYTFHAAEDRCIFNEHELIGAEPRIVSPSTVAIVWPFHSRCSNQNDCCGGLSCE